ncbi:hypothetical protein ACQR3W_21910 [Rhodococcus ruber]|uniref:Uncharacterized protein n=1 Tax=Rhodococcus ruber TaxID=1830 RepID=A0A098BLA1_9NOCA|nr:hypothetical protein [Rhodococcus ruber]MCZ4533448.1 hypothetical protein [Rhodococcus ruber]CDZ89020.1 hypothetical protein RHRU231_450187 [Rhodococcus ruber]
MNATATANLTLTGITKASSQCHCCGRTLGKVFQLSDGNDYGRTCAAKITGYSITDKLLRQAQFAARRDQQRRDENWTVDTFIAHIAANNMGILYIDGREVAADATNIRIVAEREHAALWAN